MLWAHSTQGFCELQVAGFSDETHRKAASISWFSLSVWPLLCRWKPKVRLAVPPKGSQNLGCELWPMIRDDIHWQAMEAEDVGHQEVGCLQSSREFRPRQEVGRFGELVYNGEDNRVAVGWREAGKKVQGDVGHGRLGMEQTCAGLGGGFVTGTDGAGRDVLTCVPVHGGPPEPLSENREGARYPWLAGQAARVRPLEDSGPYCIQHKKGVGGTPSWVRLLLLNLLYGRLDQVRPAT